MTKRPMLLSAHPSAWDDAADPEHRPDHAASCRFCGEPTAGWQAAFHLDSDHGNNDPGNLAIACTLCHLGQHLNRPDIDREATLIWLPELAQSEIIRLVREIHLQCHTAKTRPSDLHSVSSRISAPLLGSFAAYQALLERQEAAEARLGTISPKALGAALLELPPEATATLPDRLSGIRLLPLGRLFRDGEDIYPTILTAWSEQRNAP
jgi:intracellular multiplication protein IcmJ